MSKGKLMTTADVAAACGVTAAAVTVWARAGKLPCAGIQRTSRLFEPATVERFIRVREAAYAEARARGLTFPHRYDGLRGAK